MAPLWNKALDRLYDAALIPSYCAPGYRLRRQAWTDPELKVDMTGKVCVVTGANSGIGRATAEALAVRGADVILVCRNPERGLTAQKEIQALVDVPERISLELCDLSEPSEVDAFADRLLSTRPRLDVLVNNAGLLLAERKTNSVGIEVGFATNVLSGFLLTWRLKPRLMESRHARVIHVTSGGMYTARLRVDDLQWSRDPFDGVAAYAQNKRAQVILNELWVEHLPAHITTNCMHPGWAATPGVSTALPRFNRALQSVLRNREEGADTVVYLAVSNEVFRTTGKLFFDRQARRTHVLPMTRSTSEERLRLWQQCCELAGL